MGWKETVRGFLTLSFLRKSSPQQDIPTVRQQSIEAVNEIVRMHDLRKDRSEGQAAAAGWHLIADIIRETWEKHPNVTEAQSDLHNAMVTIGNALLAPESEMEIDLPAETMSDLVKSWGETNRTMEVLKVKPLVPTDLPSDVAPLFGRNANAKDFPHASPVARQIQDLMLINASVHRLFGQEFATRRKDDKPGNDKR